MQPFFRNCRTFSALFLLLCVASPLWGQSISINFGETDLPTALTSGVNYGVEPVDGANWNFYTGNTQATPQPLIDSTGATVTGTTLTWSSPNTWRTNSALVPTTPADNLFWSYLDDSSGNTITVTNLPYEIYDVYVYCSTDNGSVKFSTVKVNNSNYSAINGQTVAGTSTWGSSNTSRSAGAVFTEGSNYLHIESQTANTLVQKHQVSSPARGCTSAIQIVNVLPTDYAWARPDTDTTGTINLSAVDMTGASGLKLTLGTSTATINADAAKTIDILKLVDSGTASAVTVSGTQTLTFSGAHQAIYTNGLTPGSSVTITAPLAGDISLYGTPDVSQTPITFTPASYSDTLTVKSGLLSISSLSHPGNMGNFVFDGGGVLLSAGANISKNLVVDSLLQLTVPSGTAELSGSFQKLNSDSQGTIYNVSSGTLTINNASLSGFSGNIVNETGTLNLTGTTLESSTTGITNKSTLNISGSLNGYTGAITQSAGTLNITGSLNGNSGTITESGGTLNITGSLAGWSGTINHTAGTLSVSGTAPMTGATGTFNLSSSTGISFASDLDWTGFTGNINTTGSNNVTISGLNNPTFAGTVNIETSAIISDVSDIGSMAGSFVVSSGKTLQFGTKDTAYSSGDIVLPNISMASATVGHIRIGYQGAYSVDASNVTAGSLVIGDSSPAAGQETHATVSGAENISRFEVYQNSSLTLGPGDYTINRNDVFVIQTGGSITLQGGGEYTTSGRRTISQSLTLDGSNGLPITFGGDGILFSGEGILSGNAALAFSSGVNEIIGAQNFTGGLYLNGGTNYLKTTGTNGRIVGDNTVYLNSGATKTTLFGSGSVPVSIGEVILAQGSAAIGHDVVNQTITIDKLTRGQGTTLVIKDGNGSSTTDHSTITINSIDDIHTSGANNVVHGIVWLTGNSSASARVTTLDSSGHITFLPDAAHTTVSAVTTWGTADHPVSEIEGADLLVLNAANTSGLAANTSATINSLNSYHDFFVRSGAVLTITSGTIIQQNNAQWIQGGGSIRSAYSSDGGKTNDMFIFANKVGGELGHKVVYQDQNGGTNLNMIQDAYGDGSEGKVIFYGDYAQTYTGYTQINSGRLIQLGSMKTSDFRIHNSGQLYVSGTPANQKFSVAEFGTLSLESSSATEPVISAIGSTGGTILFNPHFTYNLGTRGAANASSTYNPTFTSDTFKAIEVNSSGDYLATANLAATESVSTLNLDSFTNNGGTTNLFGMGINAESVTINGGIFTFNYSETTHSLGAITAENWTTTSPAVVTINAAPVGIYSDYDPDKGLILTNNADLLTGATLAGTDIMQINDQGGLSFLETSRAADPILINSGNTSIDASAATKGWVELKKSDNSPTEVTLGLSLTGGAQLEEVINWLETQGLSAQPGSDGTSVLFQMGTLDNAILSWDWSGYDQGGVVASAAVAGQSVPEPSAWILLLLGIFIVLQQKYSRYTHRI